MEGCLAMSLKERQRLAVFEEVRKGTSSLRWACERLGVSYRQGKRSYKRFREEGHPGLVHRSRGKPSSHTLPQALKDDVLSVYEKDYNELNYGPTLAAQELAKEGLRVEPETLRRWLLAAGDWTRRRRSPAHRSWRERRPCFGELLQMDGSHHRWCGAAGSMDCLMSLIDDATGQRMALMRAGETTESAMRLLWQWIERHGIPQAVYVDGKSVFITQREPSPEEQLADRVPRTAFGEACAKLGIEVIHAHSPQAKGRVERAHGVYQDRLVKHIARYGLTSLDEVNALLCESFVDELNDKFAKPAADARDAHRPLPKGLKLAEVFCFEETRRVANDWTIRHENHLYQIAEDNRPLPRPKHSVVVRTRLDGRLDLVYRDKPLHFSRVSTTSTTGRPHPSTSKAKFKPHPKSKSNTSAPSPWRQNCTLMANEPVRSPTGKTHKE